MGMAIFAGTRVVRAKTKQQAISSGGAASGPDGDGWLSRVKRLLGDAAPNGRS